MTTLLSVYHSSRGCVGFCDKRCYDGMQPSQLKEPRRNCCICICGGANHSAGLERALRNVERGAGLSQEDLESFAQIRGLNAGDLVVLDRTRIRSKHTASRLADHVQNFKCEVT
jgi:hypothetical protein